MPKAKAEVRGVAKVNKALLDFMVPVASLKPDPENARKHSHRSVDAIRSSLKEFGFQKPLIALADGTVIAGNGQLKAAISLGWKQVPAVRFDDEKKARAFALADNQTATVSNWDHDTLEKQLKEMEDAGVDLTTLGFDEKELEKLISGGGEEQGREVKFNAKPKKPRYEVTSQERKTIDQAILAAKDQEGKDLTDGQALVLISKAFLKGKEA